MDTSPFFFQGKSLEAALKKTRVWGPAGLFKRCLELFDLHLIRGLVCLHFIRYKNKTLALSFNYNSCLGSSSTGPISVQLFPCSTRMEDELSPVNLEHIIVLEQNLSLHGLFTQICLSILANNNRTLEVKITVFLTPKEIVRPDKYDTLKAGN